jgi:hypothetical protein
VRFVVTVYANRQAVDMKQSFDNPAPRTYCHDASLLLEGDAPTALFLRGFPFQLLTNPSIRFHAGSRYPAKSHGPADGFVLPVAKCLFSIFRGLRGLPPEHELFQLP